MIVVCILCTVFSGVTAATPEDLRNADVSELVRRPKFDSREYGTVTPVRDQGNTSLCWAYATVNASETSILRSGLAANANNLSLSPFQIGYARHNRGADPLGNTTGEVKTPSNWQNEGGGTKYAAALLSQWCGPVDAETPYNADGWKNAVYKLESAIAVNGKNTDTDISAREKMKKAIVKYGAVTFSYNNARELFYYNPKGEKNGYPHACTVIGWDDTIPAEKFGPGETAQDGGWLVKNSYASLPYFYLSYDTVCEQIYAFEYAANDKYDRNYFYDAIAEDSGVGSLMKPTRAANVFEARGENEYIKAVNTEIIGEDVSYTVEIYTGLCISDGNIDYANAVLAATQTKTAEYGGYICNELEHPVKIEKGTAFAVAVTLKSDNGSYIALSLNEGNSYVYRNGWIKYAAPRIKVFTKSESKKRPYIEFVGNNKIKAAADVGEKCRFVLAEFDGKQLKRIYTVPLDFSTETEKTTEIPSEWGNSGNSVYKAFLWGGVSGIEPLCRAETSD